MIILYVMCLGISYLYGDVSGCFMAVYIYAILNLFLCLVA